MSNLLKEIAGLSMEKRVLLERRLMEKRAAASPSPAAQREASATPSLIKSDDENLSLTTSADSVDALNSTFYGKYPYPWSPAKFDYVLDPDFRTIMLNQDLGDWQHRTVPRNPRIWVAGCGTNQAIFTALRFPNAEVIGSDISANSLEMSRNTARELGLRNVELRQESINHISYEDEFDYVICTGVIHHNADPKAALDKLASALKRTGILELMVYNRYHRTFTTAFQKAIRLFCASSSIDFESELLIARKIIDSFPVRGAFYDFLSLLKGAEEAQLTDSLLQPVEYSYTVASLVDLVKSCHLELAAPCLNIFDKTGGSFSWNMKFSDAELQALYDSLHDFDRWQMTNLLLLESSPMLWFYARPEECGQERKSEQQICDGFLNATFVREMTTQRSYIKDADGKYRLSPKSLPYPLSPLDDTLKKILAAVNGEVSMRDILQRLGISTAFQDVNLMRLRLTTSEAPYLRAVQAGVL